MEEKLLLIHKVLTGQASAQENTQYELEKENKREFKELSDDISMVWEDRLPELPFEINSEVAFSQFLDGIKNVENTTITLPKTKVFRLSNIMKIAAAFLVLVSAAFIINSNNSSFELRNDTDIATHSLVDNSQITLNSNAVLIGASDFNENNRTVSLLNGEAFFKIAKNKKKPFIIKMEEVQVLVTGTAFDIDNNDEHIIVSVEEGSVEVTANDAKYVLSIGDQLTYNKKNKAFELSEVRSKNVFNWTRQELAFESTSLNVVFDDISRFYNVDINYPKSAKLCGKYNSPVLKNKTLKSVLETISLTYGLKVDYKDESEIEILNLNCK